MHSASIQSITMLTLKGSYYTCSILTEEVQLETIQHPPKTDYQNPVKDRHQPSLRTRKVFPGRRVDECGENRLRSLLAVCHAPQIVFVSFHPTSVVEWTTVPLVPTLRPETRLALSFVALSHEFLTVTDQCLTLDDQLRPGVDHKIAPVMMKANVWSGRGVPGEARDRKDRQAKGGSKTYLKLMCTDIQCIYTNQDFLCVCVCVGGGGG